MIRKLALFGCGLMLLAASSLGQQVTGLPPFGSFSGGPTDTVNNANLNVHFAFPVFSRAGRGMPFSYTLTYDTGVWNPITSGSSKVWSPGANWGWNAVTQAPLGYVTYVASSHSCVGPPPGNQQVSWTVWNSFAYVDWAGTAHRFFGLVLSNWQNDSPCGVGNPSSGTVTAEDGSGYTLSASADDDGDIYTSLSAPSGAAINAPQLGAGSGGITDTNGNTTSANFGSTTTFTDTLGTAALTVSGSNPMVFSYPNPQGGTSSYKMNYSSYNVRTNFGCSGISEYSSAQNLASSITLPDGTSYQFTYESTPGYAGYVTGRLSSIALPTGGTITYTYSGGNNGIVCADGSAATLTRTTPDGTWTYAHSESGSAWTTTVTDPQGNQTAMQFYGIYETQRIAYQALSSSGTLLATVNTCYNGSGTSCTTSPGLPITEVTQTTSLPGSSALVWQTVSQYNGYGLVTEVDETAYYNYEPGPVLRKTLTNYNGSLGNIVDHPSWVQLQDGNGNVISQTSYSYDEYAVQPGGGGSHSGPRGNATTVSRLVSGSSSLVQHFHYYDTGNVYEAIDANGATTTYTYGNCNNAFVSSVSLPLGLSTSQSWNCAGGVQTSVTDVNGHTSSVGYSDANYWRPTSTTDATGAVTSVGYSNATNSWATESTLNFNGSVSTADVRTTLDGLGRTHVTQRKQSQSSSSYDSVESDYDALGRPSRVTLPYSGTAGQTSSSAPGTVTTYDALGRPATVKDSGGGQTIYTPDQNDMLMEVDGQGPGENAKKRQFEYDALGRLTSVCEVTSGTGSGTCYQTNQLTGYWTAYTYDPNNNLLSVAQNEQSPVKQNRTYSYDGLGRMTSETNPETGTVSYSYDTDSTCGSSSAGDLVKRVDAAGNVTCYWYDVLHRMTAVTYPSGPNSAATPQKNFVYDAATVNGAAMANAKGRLAEAYTGPSSGKITDLGFSYSARGEVTDTYEATPNSGGYYHVTATYWPNGLLNVLTPNQAGLPNWTYTPEGEGRISSVSASSGQSPVSSTTYSGFGQAASINYGSLDSDGYTYDPNSGRMTQYAFHVNGSSETGTLTWNANGSLQKLAISDPFNSSDTQTCTSVYDDLARVASQNCGSIWSQNFTYDL
ncbi:MAG: hypothetical protein WB992_06685, partial [Bryobacteraceae bacterium]